jgi:hypothetical protein
MRMSSVQTTKSEEFFQALSKMATLYCDGCNCATAWRYLGPEPVYKHVGWIEAECTRCNAVAPWLDVTFDRNGIS